MDLFKTIKPGSHCAMNCDNFKVPIAKRSNLCIKWAITVSYHAMWTRLGSTYHTQICLFFTSDTLFLSETTLNNGTTVVLSGLFEICNKEQCAVNIAPEVKRCTIDMLGFIKWTIYTTTILFTIGLSRFDVWKLKIDSID